MLRQFLRMGFALAAMASFEAARAETPALDRPRLEAFVDGAVHEAMRSRHIAGVTVAIVDRSGVAMARGYGIAALSPRKAVDADTLFRVGSISKTAVWISLMQLVEQGKLSLDDPINDLGSTKPQPTADVLIDGLTPDRRPRVQQGPSCAPYRSAVYKPVRP